MNKSSARTNSNVDKYLDDRDFYNPLKSDAVKNAYKEQRAQKEIAQKDTSCNIWERIFKKPF